jgi:phosphoribosylformylglycinamidine cyclo-ligase
MRVRVVNKQRNSRMCLVCGLKNPYGLMAAFHEMENGELVALFTPHDEHQGYPGLLHGGITALHASAARADHGLRLRDRGMACHAQPQRSNGGRHTRSTCTGAHRERPDMTDALSYRKSGVDIDAADRAKTEIAKKLETSDPRVLNRVGAFASLFEARFPGYREPVLVMKMEEPGSKQKLALRHGRLVSLCHDLVNHLVNDIAVMGARPLAVQDVIVCGHLDPDTVTRLVGAIADACRNLGCSLVGGETSEQPRVLDRDTYILAASVVGVAEKSQVLDGSSIRAGDALLALASNGLHTNGYTLVRALLDRIPDLANRRVGGQSFIDAILQPHTSYLRAIEGLFGDTGLHGLAHITGGGIRDNLKRILPAVVDSVVDLRRVRPHPVFRVIREAGAVGDTDMLRTFNVGVGMLAVVEEASADRIASHLRATGVETYPIGAVRPGSGRVTFQGTMDWGSEGA